MVDIYPTLCELVGIDLPGHLEGKSMVSLMQNPMEIHKKAAVTRWRNGASVTTADFSYTEWDDQQRMLFDLRRDHPEENENIAENPDYTETIKELGKLLRKDLN